MRKVLSVAGKTAWRLAKEVVSGVAAVMSVLELVVSKKGGEK